MTPDFLPDERIAPLLGIVRNVPAEALPPGALVTCRNMRLRTGALEKIDGWQRRGTTVVDGTPVYLGSLPFPIIGTVTVLATTDWIYKLALDGTVTKLHTEPMGLTYPDRWTVDYLLGKWYFASQAGGLWSWNGQGQLQEVDTDGVNGAFLAQFENHLLLANLTTADGSGAHQFLGSGLQAADWDTANAASDADLVSIPDAGGAFQGLRRLPGGLALYKEKSIHHASYISLPNVYAIDQRSEGVGLLAPHSLVSNYQAHVFVGTDNLYAFTGGLPTPLGARIWRWWQGEQTADQRTAVWAFDDCRHQEIYFVWGDRALVWNYEHNVFYEREFPFTAVGFVARSAMPTFDELTMPMDEIGNLKISGALEDYDLVGLASDGKTYNFTADTNNGAGELITAELQTGTVGGGLYVRACGGLLLDVAELTGNPLQVFVSGRKSLGDPLRWKGPYLYRGGDRVHCTVTGRYHDFKFVKPGGRFVLRGYAPLWRELN